jgi:hypothetical protein
MVLTILYLEDAPFDAHRPSISRHSSRRRGIDIGGSPCLFDFLNKTRMLAICIERHYFVLEKTGIHDLN